MSTVTPTCIYSFQGMVRKAIFAHNPLIRYRRESSYEVYLWSCAAARLISVDA